MARQSKKVISNASLQDAEAAMASVAAINSKLKVIEGRMEQEKQKIDEKYRQDIERLTDDKKEPLEVLEVFAKSDAKNWTNKSYDLTHGTIGFRTNPPKLEKKKGFTWDGITELLLKHLPQFVRVKSEPDKEAIIAMRDDGVFMDQMEKNCFVTVVQDETFWVKTKEEELATA